MDERGFGWSGVGVILILIFLMIGFALIGHFRRPIEGTVSIETLALNPEAYENQEVVVVGNAVVVGAAPGWISDDGGVFDLRNAPWDFIVVGENCRVVGVVRWGPEALIDGTGWFIDVSDIRLVYG